MPRSIMDDSYDPIYEQVKGILGERMLLSEAGEEMRIDNPDVEIEWEFEELDDDEDTEDYY